MLLKELLKGTKIVQNNDVDIEKIEAKNLSRDSRKTGQGDVFFCLTDDYDKACQRCKQAFENGASVVVSDFSMPFERTLKVDDCRDVFARACANFYERACDRLKMIGITGTNGKTTTSHVIAQMLKRNGKKVGVIGTNGVYFSGRRFDCPLTTPDADFLHKTFLEMKNAGVEFVVMEVSAHAIDQKRINGINFDVGVLTNVTQDHLDYFKTFDVYEKTKLDFLTKKHCRFGVVCADDKSARKLLENADIPLVTYGLFSPADVFAVDVDCSLNGSHFVGNVCDELVEIKTNLIGQYNVYNCLASLAVCQHFGLDSMALARGLNFISPVEGRFNVINLTGKYIVIDFAHSPDSLKNVLKTARTLSDGRVFVVFGCGGNRDKTKRPLMGEIAEKFADFVCLTDDNPRMENSLNIIGDIELGMRKAHMVEPDRKTAIKKMIDLAKPGDIVLIAGKGAEKYQEIGTEKRPYNDFETVYEIFQESNPIRNRKGRDYDGC